MKIITKLKALVKYANIKLINNPSTIVTIPFSIRELVEIEDAIKELEVLRDYEITSTQEVAETLINFFSKQDEDKTIIIIGCGKSFTTSELIEELKNKTDVGKKIIQSIITLSIDLVFREKELI